MTRGGDTVLTVAAGLVLGAIVHLGSVLTLPALATRHADARLAAFAPRHQFVPLPATEAADALADRDPATPLAVCRFDVAQKPLRVRMAVSDLFTSLAFHSTGGGVFYALTDRSALRGQLDILVVTRRQLEVLQANDPEDEPVRELRLVAPEPTGFVTVRILAPEQSLGPQAEAALKAAQCAPETLSGKP